MSHATMPAKLLPIFLIWLVAACGPSNNGSAIEAPGDVGTVEHQPTPPDDRQWSHNFLSHVSDRVFFDYDRYELTATARATLARQAEWLRRFPDRQVIVQGHADERGTREYNLALGERRATAIRNYLMALGVSQSRITTVSFGEEQPAFLGATEDAWAQNRRGVTVVN